MSSIQPHHQRQVGIWLLLCCLLLLSLVVLGGATRLTGSGLSMVEWEPVTGMLPPVTAGQWMREFDAYRASPEFRIVRRGMSLDEFKTIYWFEFGHRLLARLLGLVFALPLAWFLWKGRIPRRLRALLVAILGLGAFQGWVGWFMVQSGLVDVPRVSPYRLVLHLSLALTIVALMYRVALGLMAPGAHRRHALRRWTVALLVLTALTIMFGAFVAGLRAGLVYNDFPLMAGHWVPGGMLSLEPLWRNFFENTATVQFAHRLLALSTLTTAVAAWFRARRHRLDKGTRNSFVVLLLVACVQVALGVATLMLYVPVVLAVLHQAVAVFLLAAVITTDYRVGHSPLGTADTDMVAFGRIWPSHERIDSIWSRPRRRPEWRQLSALRGHRERCRETRSSPAPGSARSPGGRAPSGSGRRR